MARSNLAVAIELTVDGGALVAGIKVARDQLASLQAAASGADKALDQVNAGKLDDVAAKAGRVAGAVDAAADAVDELGRSSDGLSNDVARAQDALSELAEAATDADKALEPLDGAGLESVSAAARRVANDVDDSSRAVAELVDENAALIAGVRISQEGLAGLTNAATGADAALSRIDGAGIESVGAAAQRAANDMASGTAAAEHLQNAAGGVVTPAANAGAALGRMGQAADDAKRKIGGAGDSGGKINQLVPPTRRATSEVQQLGRAADLARAHLNGLASARSMMMGMMSGAATALSGLFVIDRVIDMGAAMVNTAAEAQRLERRLQSLVGTGVRLAETQQWLSETADRLGQDAAEMSASYAQFLNLSKSGLVTIDEARSLTEGMANAQIKFAADSGRMGNVMYGLSQALASPIVRMEELNQVVEPLPGLLLDLDKAADLPAGGFRKLVAEGRVTSDMFRDTLVKALGSYAGTAEKSADTVDAAYARMANARRRFMAEGGKPLAEGWTNTLNFVADAFNWGNDVMTAANTGAAQNALTREQETLNNLLAVRQQLDADRQRYATGGAGTWATNNLAWKDKAIGENEQAIDAALVKILTLRKELGLTRDSWEFMYTAAEGDDAAGKALDKLRGQLGDVATSLGLVINPTGILTKSEQELADKTEVLSRVLALPPEQLRALGISTGDAASMLEALRQKLDPVAAAIASLNRETAALSFGPRVRGLYEALDQAERSKGSALTDKERIDLTAAWYQRQTAKSGDQVRLAKEAAAAATALADAQATGSRSAEALARANLRVKEALRDGVIVPADEAAYKAAILEQETAGLAQAQGTAATSAKMAERQAWELAAATGVSAFEVREATIRHEAERLALTDKSKTYAQHEAHVRALADAESERLAKEWDRDLDAQIRALKDRTEAERLGAEAVAAAAVETEALAQIEREAVKEDSARADAIKAKTKELAAYKAAAEGAAAVREAGDELAYRNQVQGLRGLTGAEHDRAVRSLEIRRQAEARFANQSTEALRKQKNEWIGLQERIADTDALEQWHGEVGRVSADIAGDLAAQMFDKGGDILDWWRNLLKRMAIEIVSTKFIMPIVQQVVGSAPGLFGVSSQPTAAGGVAGTASNGLVSAASNLGMNTASNYISNKLGWGAGGWTGALDSWGASVGIGGTAATMPTTVSTGAGGLLTGGGATSIVPGQMTGIGGTGIGLGGAASGVLGAAGMGYMVGGMLGTKTNSKGVGALGGAAAGAAYGTMILPGWGTAIGAVIGAIAGMLGTQKATVGPNSAAAVNVSANGFHTGRVMQDNGGDLKAAQQAGDATSQYLSLLIEAAGAKMNAVPRELSAIWHFEKDDTWRSVVQDKEEKFDTVEEAMVDLAKRTFAALGEYGEVLVSANVQKALDNSKAKDPETLANDIAFAKAFEDTVATMTNQLRVEDDARKAGADSAASLNTQIKEFHAKVMELGLDIGQATTATWTWIDGLIAGREATEYSELEGAMVALRAYWDGMIPVLQQLGYTAEQATARMAEGYANNLAILRSDASEMLDARLRYARGESGIDEVKALIDGYEATLRDIEVVWRDDLTAQALQAGKATETLSLQVAELAASGQLSAGDLRRLIDTLKDTPAAAEAASAALGRVLEQSWDRAQASLLGAVGRDLPAALKARMAGLSGDTNAWILTVGAMMDPTLDLARAQAVIAALMEDNSVTAGEFSASLELLTGALQDAKAAADQAAQINEGLASRERALYLAGLPEGPERVRAEQQAKINAEMDAAVAAGYSSEQLRRLANVLQGEFSAAMKAARDAIRQTIDGVRSSVNSALLGDRQMTADELFLTTGYGPTGLMADLIRGLFDAVDAGQQPAERLREVFANLTDQFKSGAINADLYQSVMQGVVSRYQSGTQALAQVQSSVRDYLSGLRTSIAEYLDAMAVSDGSQLTLAEKLARAQADFAAQMTKARGGEGISLQDQRAAISSITQYADRLLAVGLEWNASGLDQRALQDWVTAQLQALPDQISELEMVRLEIAALNAASDVRTGLIAATVEDAADQITIAIGLMRADLNGDLKVDWGEFQAWAIANSSELDAIAAALGLSNASLGSIFSELDTNGDGVLSAVEAARAAIVTAVTANPSAIATALGTHFDTLDTSVNGLLSYAEFSAGLVGIATDAELKKIFTEIDTNGDAQLSRLELVRSGIVAAVNAQGASVTASGIASSLAPYFSMLNTTSGDALTYAEFAAGLAGSKVASDANMTAWFSALDANDDGQLSKLELMRAAEVATNSKIDTGNATLSALSSIMTDARNNTMNTINAIVNSTAAAQVNAQNIVNAINMLPHAGGGSASGLTMINDGLGPEFVRLPGGSHVLTASASIAMARQLATEINPPSAQIIAMPVMAAPIMMAAPAGGGGSDQVVTQLRALTDAVDRLAERLPQGDQAVVEAVGEVVDAVKDVGKTIRQSSRQPVARRVAS